VSTGAPVVIAILDGPWGPIHVAASDHGVAAIELMTPTEPFVAGLERRFRSSVVSLRDRPSDDPAARTAKDTLAILEAYFDGTPIEESPVLDIGDRSGWDREVLGGVRSVGYGEVVSYGGLARRVGRPGAARAVGGAVGRNPIGILIPCHRVIAGDGTIGGYGGAWWGTRERHLDIKRELLEREGIRLPVMFTAG
jgi:methylated-DNA-[protein]-cysteine S-methyltransferase